ncbi:MAG: carboxypeptidase regulatory-like domain-containing protein, partial [Acidobacteriota bacterium]
MKYLLSACTLALCLLSSQAALAQTTSIIAGTVMDSDGLPLAGARLFVSGNSLIIPRTVATDDTGRYRLPALPAGAYHMIVSHAGFVARSVNFELALNSTLRVDVSLEVGRLQEEEVTIHLEELQMEADTSSAGRVITPRQIREMPLNGRKYLDLLQLVPGVSLNRQADSGSDAAVPVLGERAGNTGFLLDGFSNQNTFKGGAAAQLNQDTIAEFQVLTTGYKAEFGYASGGIVNAVSKTGTNDWHGGFSVFYRNQAFDASNVREAKAPQLQRLDYSLSAGGPILRERIFFFGSAERIAERRQLNFTFPARTPQGLREFESKFNQPNKELADRVFLKFEEQQGRHHLTQQANWTVSHLSNFLPLSRAMNLPSSRQDMASRTLMLGLGDMALLGNQSEPFVLTLRGQYDGQVIRRGGAGA